MNTFDVAKMKARGDTFKVITHEQYPNAEVEKPWYSPRKFAKVFKSTNSLISTVNKMTPASTLIKPTVSEVIKDKINSNMNKTKKDEIKEEE